jgi:hypothetical protein
MKRAQHPIGDDVRNAAHAYAARGWSVIPIEPRGKRPLVAWLEFQERRAERDEIDAWYRHWPDANVGVVTGRVSGIVVIDVDAKHGGFESLSAIERDLGGLPDTVAAVTGGGGRHLYFDHPREALRNRVGLRPGIDLRADGGCVVAPPSVHPSGRRYAWVTGRGPDQNPVAKLPPWLLDMLRNPARRRHSLEHWRHLVREGVDEGERNATLASLAGHLLCRGVHPEVSLELLLGWNRLRCRPPLTDDEVARVVQSIARRHEREQGGAT